MKKYKVLIIIYVIISNFIVYTDLKAGFVGILVTTMILAGFLRGSFLVGKGALYTMMKNEESDNGTDIILYYLMPAMLFLIIPILIISENSLQTFMLYAFPIGYLMGGYAQKNKCDED